MRLLGFIPGFVLGGVALPNHLGGDALQDQIEDPFESNVDPLEEKLEEIDGDIKFTPCQAELMRRNNIDVPDSSVGEDIDNDEYCDQIQKNDASGNHRGALVNYVRFWKDHFNEATNRYKIPYMFDGSHYDHQKARIRKKLAEFRQNTCVDLVEIPWEEANEGPFGGKYDNVFSVSQTCAVNSLNFLKFLFLYNYFKLTRNTRGCWSYIGKSYRHKQPIGLASGCEDHYIPLHEIMHGLGFHHEHTR